MSYAIKMFFGTILPAAVFSIALFLPTWWPTDPHRWAVVWMSIGWLGTGVWWLVDLDDAAQLAERLDRWRQDYHMQESKYGAIVAELEEVANLVQVKPVSVSHPPPTADCDDVPAFLKRQAD